MEDNLKKSAKLGHPADSSDAKYLSGLSTILVATIQEAKDRISQIEYIFCSQLFPNFHLKSQNLQKLYSEAREVAEDAYKEKEKDLLLQIEKLQGEMQQVLEENRLLNLEKAKLTNMDNLSPSCYEELQKELNQKTVEVNEWRDAQQNLQKLLNSKESLILRYESTMKEVEEKDIMFSKKQRCLEVENEKLRLGLMKKSKEVDEIMELNNKLLQINQSKISIITQKDMQLKENEDKANGLISKLENTERKVDGLLSGLREKTQEVDKGKDLQENLLKKIEYQALEIMNNEQLLNKYEKDNRLLASKIENLVKCIDELKEQLRKNNNDLEEERKVKEQLLLQIESFNFEKSNRVLESKEFEKERKQLLDKQKILEERIDKLQQNLSERSKESSIQMELHGKLLQQIEAKDSELLFEKRKRREHIALYKKLKSQYNYVCKKFNLIPETMLSPNKIEDENEILRQDQTPVTSHAIENQASKANGISSEVTRPVEEQEISEDYKRIVLIQRSNPVSSSSPNISISPKCQGTIKTHPPAGAKRPISYWRNTRSHQSRVGPDPHDDFLDTPLENARENFGKAMKEDMHNLPQPGTKNMKLNNSDDDETQDMNVDPAPQIQQMSPGKAETSGFKYVEPVRKKSDRESLKGIECRQCKKFYDAVLPDGGENVDGNKQNIRCEHHNGVSRHRYRYAPPLTPEGFWNIGFESEM